MSREVTGGNGTDRRVTRSEAVRARLLREGVEPSVLERIAWVFEDWVPPEEPAPPEN